MTTSVTQCAWGLCPGHQRWLTKACSEPVLLASAGGKEPRGVAMGCPGEAPECQGVMRQGARAVLGALPAVDVDHGARAIAIAYL